MKEVIKYTEIAKAKISKARSIVISECSKGGITIAQQLDAVEDGEIVSVFLKGAFHIENVDSLIELRNAINYVIDKLENEQKDPEDWDEEKV